jgi:hypothetical protein
MHLLVECKTRRAVSNEAAYKSPLKSWTTFQRSIECQIGCI